VSQEKQSTPEYDQARQASLSAATSARIYGVRLTGHRALEGYFPIWYCGRVVRGQDFRHPTKMIWQIPEAKVRSSGDVKDFLYEEYQVQWFDVELGAQPIEEHFRLVNLAVESTSARPSAVNLRQGDEDAGTVLNLGQTRLEDDSPLEGSAATPEDTLVAAAVLRSRGQTKEFYWEVPSNVHGCGLAGAHLTLTSDGSASWRGVVNSIYDDDAYCVTLSFLNSGGGELFRWPRFCSQTLWRSPQVWTNNNLAFSIGFYRSIEIVRRYDHC
jgi:hypothetical protein